MLASNALERLPGCGPGPAAGLAGDAAATAGGVWGALGRRLVRLDLGDNRLRELPAEARRRRRRSGMTTTTI